MLNVTRQREGADVISCDTFQSNSFSKRFDDKFSIFVKSGSAVFDRGTKSGKHLTDSINANSAVG